MTQQQLNFDTLSDNALAFALELRRRGVGLFADRAGRRIYVTTPHLATQDVLDGIQEHWVELMDLISPRKRPKRQRQP